MMVLLPTRSRNIKDGDEHAKSLDVKTSRRPFNCRKGSPRGQQRVRDPVLGRDACLANQEVFRLERQASGNRLAAKVRRGEQLDARKLHQPQPPEADSAAAQRAQDPEDDKGLRVTLVARRAAPGAADDKGSGATLELSS